MKKTIILISLILSVGFLLADTIFFDDFENSSGWTLTGEFEIGQPNGLGGDHGNTDPMQAFEGTNVLGVDLSGYGNYPGDYEPNLSEDEYAAYSPAIDCSGYIDVTLSFKRWLGIEQPAYDHARIKISNDNGSSWQTIWENSQTISDNSWQDIQLDLSSYANLHSSVIIAFTIGTTDGSWQYCGWNIDNFTISGTAVQYGTIEGHIYDSQTLLPVSNAMVSTSYSYTFSDSEGYYIISNAPALPTVLTVSALGYQTYTSQSITPPADSTMTYDVYMNILENLPPSPQNLTATVQYNTVNLSWLPPQENDYYLIAYNIYRNNILIASTPDTLYTDTGLVLGEYTYYVAALFDVGSSLPSNSITVNITSTFSNNNQIIKPNYYLQNYPNPFNPSTTIEYYLSSDKENVSLKVYNLKGEKINEYYFKMQKAGIHKIVWNGKNKSGNNIPSGLYFYTLFIDKKAIATQKAILLK